MQRISFSVSQSEPNSVPFLYHMSNKCYKGYTMSKTLISLAGKRKRDDDEGNLYTFTTSKIIIIYQPVSFQN